MWSFKHRNTTSKNIVASGSLNDKLDHDRKKKRRGLRFFHAEAFTSSVEDAADGYQSPSLIASGAQAQDVAVSTSITNLVLSFLLLKILPGFHARTSTKRASLIVALCSALGWLPLIFVLLLRGRVSLYWLIGLWMVSLIPGTLVIPLRDDWMSELIPAGRMGRYLGLRSAISAATYLGAFLVMGFILDSYTGQIFTGYGIVIAIAFVASFASFILYAAIRSPTGTSVEADTRYGFIDFIKETRRGHLGTFIVYVSLFTFSVSLASPLFVVYMLKDLHFSYLTYTLIVCTEYLARIISLGLWGRYLDKVGGPKVLVIVSCLIPFVPILWLFSSRVPYLVIVQLCSGALWAAFDVSRQTHIYQAAPEGKRFRYILYHRSLSTLSLAVGALAGGYLLNFVPPIFGNKILGIFLASGLLRLLVLIGLLPSLRGSDSVAQGEPAASSSAQFKGVAVKEGLFYHPKLWADYSTQNPGLKAEAHKAHAEPVKKGLYYKPELWLEYYPGLKDTIARGTPKAVVAKKGLYYKPELWLEYYPNSEPKVTRAGAKTQNGLFHNPRLWSEHPKPISFTTWITTRTMNSPKTADMLWSR